ncbi:MAG: IS110 family transposase [Methylocella sp.]
MSPGDSHNRRLIDDPFCWLGCFAEDDTVCVVDDAGRRLWRGQCPTVPEQINALVHRYAGDDARIGIETGAMTPWLVHELRNLGLEVACLDAGHARAALKIQINKTDQNDAEGLAQIVRTGWYRAVHVKSFGSHRARALLGARAQLVGMTTRLSNHNRGVLKTFGLLPGSNDLAGTSAICVSGAGWSPQLWRLGCGSTSRKAESKRAAPASIALNGLR